jgi:hypothetical protein
MKFENIDVMNFGNALRGMRNPKNSWHLSDSAFGITHLDNLSDIAEEVAQSWVAADDIMQDSEMYDVMLDKYTDILLENGVLHVDDEYCTYAFIGPKDMRLAKALIRGGSEHRKFLRQIMVSVDITAPLYWWKEFDTYKVGTVANSTSTMHKLAETPITLDCFEIDDYDSSVFTNPEEIDYFIQFLEGLRIKFLATKDQRYWKELIRWLPNGWLQKRTVTMNYENLLAMCSPGQRRFHKLNEWSGKDEPALANFISFARKLPYAPDFIFLDEQA